MGDPKRYEYSYELRKVDSARVYVGRRVDGRLEARIAHAPLRGVTSEMLVWWFENFADGPDAIEDDLSTRKTARVGEIERDVRNVGHLSNLELEHDLDLAADSRNKRPFPYHR